jgi:hypothetical protein
MGSAVSELNWLLELNVASLLDDLVDLDGGNDALGEVVKVEDRSLCVNNRCHLFLFCFFEFVEKLLFNNRLLISYWLGFI